MNKQPCIPLLVLLSLTSCGAVNPSSSEESKAIAPQEGEALVYVREGKAELRWDLPSYSAFRIYGSESKYGQYHLISGESPIKTPSFSTSSYRYGYYKVMGIKDEEELAYGPISAFGQETLIVDEHDDLRLVQEEIDEKHSRLESAGDGQFSSERFATLFLPGQYNDIEMKLGYYSSAFGLGKIPDDTKVGSLFVSTEVLDNNNSTCTFWRNAANLYFPEDTQFAVSQATSLRRCHFGKNLALSHPSGWSSGGFLADSKVEGRIDSRTQQQWMSRNDEFARWNGNSHNYVFSGCIGQTPAHSWSEATSRTTIVEETPNVAEAPFLYMGEQSYQVFVPALRKNSKGLSWSEESMGAGKSIPLDDFYLANAKIDDASTLNSALSQGKSILFSPGIYTLDAPLKVTAKDSVLMGIGYATLQIANKEGALIIDDVDGVRVSGLLLDAGERSDYMLQVGEKKSAIRHEENPVILSDLFCRIGGKENAHTEVEDTVRIYSSDVIGDNLWLWRADHSQGVAWEDEERGNGRINYGNPAYCGLRVYGDYVTMYGLMVEHFEEYQTYWIGEYGRTIMYQSETPYRVPAQDYWYNQKLERDGYASYKVSDNVNHHRAEGIGIYWVHYTYDFLESAIEAPIKEDVKFEHLVTTTFSGNANGGIRHVINDYGDAVGEGGKSRALVASYPVQE